jgi:uncharacterized protein DUF3562
MMTSTSGFVDSNGEHASLITKLSDELHLPLSEVDGVYSEQLDRLEADARIRSYLGVLAVRNTRSVLRARAKQSGALNP